MPMRPLFLNQEQAYAYLSRLAGCARDGLELTVCIAIDSDLTRRKDSGGLQQMYSIWGTATTNNHEL